MPSSSCVCNLCFYRTIRLENGNIKYQNENFNTSDINQARIYIQTRSRCVCLFLAKARTTASDYMFPSWELHIAICRNKEELKLYTQATNINSLDFNPKELIFPTWRLCFFSFFIWFCLFCLSFVDRWCRNSQKWKFSFPRCMQNQNKKSDFSLCHSIFYRLRVFIFIDFASGTFARCFYLYFFFANVINPSADVNLRQPQPLFEEEKKYISKKQQSDQRERKIV